MHACTMHEPIGGKDISRILCITYTFRYETTLVFPTPATAVWYCSASCVVGVPNCVGIHPCMRYDAR